MRDKYTERSTERHTENERETEKEFTVEQSIICVLFWAKREIPEINIHEKAKFWLKHENFSIQRKIEKKMSSFFYSFQVRWLSWYFFHFFFVSCWSLRKSIASNWNNAPQLCVNWIDSLWTLSNLSLCSIMPPFSPQYLAGHWFSPIIQSVIKVHWFSEQMP